jgi:leader peptidase (prepilin peptidase)/N-methyltransferase
MPTELADHVVVFLGVLGLLVGSFLNVVIHRLPKMMERQWEVECAQGVGAVPPPAEPFNLMVPRSTCPRCAAGIAWYDNLPIISYALLHGRCRKCQAPIALRYPAVELCSALLFAFCGWHWGMSPAAFAWCAWMAGMLSLALIDWDCTLLPDAIVLPLLWLGLIGANLQWTGVSLEHALWGAVVGYLSLWSVYWVFKLVTGKEGMGYGDFKLLACLGAWFGWQALVPIILMSSVIGALVGIALKLNQNLREGGVMPFGPFLVGAGLACLFANAAGFKLMVP